MPARPAVRGRQRAPQGCRALVRRVVVTLPPPAAPRAATLQVVPMPPRIASEAVGLFLITMILGFTSIFLK